MVAGAAIVGAAVGLMRFAGKRPTGATSLPAGAVASTKASLGLYAELARFEPPDYNRAVRHGVGRAGEGDFRSAMNPYLKRDWPGCRSALENVSGRYPKLIEARYYLAICSLSSGHIAEGAAALRQVIADGDTPYLEEAHFYLAKALLAGGDAEQAKTELRKTIAMGGHLEPQASALAARIP